MLKNENDAYNIDFAFVKKNHVSNQTILAVSGSSGKLKNPPPAKTDAVWAGQIYNEDNLTFEQQTNKYIDLKKQAKEKKEQDCDKDEEKKKLNQDEEKPRISRSIYKNNTFVFFIMLFIKRKQNC